MPDRVGGQRMAKLVTQPDIVEFLDFMMLQEPGNVIIEELSLKDLANCFEKFLHQLAVLEKPALYMQDGLKEYADATTH